MSSLLFRQWMTLVANKRAELGVCICNHFFHFDVSGITGKGIRAASSSYAFLCFPILYFCDI